MLIISLSLLIVYCSFINNTIENIKNINRIGIISLLYILLINILSLDIEYLQSGIDIYNGYYKLTINTQLMLILVIISSILLIYPLSVKISENYNYFKKDLILLLIFNILGLILVMISNDLISLYIGIELQSYGLYLITSINNQSNKSSKSSLFYFLIGGLASIILLLSIALIYYLIGDTNMNNIQLMNNQNLDIPFIFLIIALLIKVGAGPFHNWSISIYTETPLIITAWISIMGKISLLTILWSIILIIQSFKTLDNTNIILYIITLFSILSMLIGSFNGLNQIKIRSLFAYSGILNMGYLIIAISCYQGGEIGYIFYLIQYTLTHILFFLILLLINYYNNNKDILFIIQLKGLYYYNPYLAISFIITFFSLIGIPPLLGFYAKFYILISTISTGYVLASLFIIITSSISTVYYAYIIKTMWSKPINNINLYNNIYISSSISYIISCLTLLIFLTSLYFYPLLKVISIWVNIYNVFI